MVAQIAFSCKMKSAANRCERKGRRDNDDKLGVLRELCC
jgi:hypothetical protein